ncbi:hypothetical protein EYS14_06505 [Alteromonadaceae bacterium M269]|nr:hypothetical protein EYS14_06505 [Alteromonadaceae bacterium M269]
MASHKRKSKYPLIFISLLLLGVGLFVGFYNAESINILPSRVMSVDAAAINETNLSKQDLDTAFEKVNKLIYEHVESAKRYQLIENTLKWLGIIAAAIITFIAAFSGQVVQPEAGAGKIDETKLKDKTLRLVGILAAINTVCIGLQSPINESKTSSLERADKLFETAMTTRQKILDSKDADGNEQQALLNKLIFEASRP